MEATDTRILIQRILLFILLLLYSLLVFNQSLPAAKNTISHKPGSSVFLPSFSTLKPIYFCKLKINAGKAEVNHLNQSSDIYIPFLIREFKSISDETVFNLYP
jgi:hypothetical protein